MVSSDRYGGVEVAVRVVLTASPVATEKYLASKCDVPSAASTKQPSLELSRNNMHTSASTAVESVKRRHHRACRVGFLSSLYDNPYIEQKGKNALSLGRAGGRGSNKSCVIDVTACAPGSLGGATTANLEPRPRDAAVARIKRLCAIGRY
jgi:hypothetical protein